MAGELELDDLESPFQSKSFYDCMISKGNVCTLDTVWPLCRMDVTSTLHNRLSSL